MANPTGISTGQGKGEAQVFESFKTDYYDKKYNEAKGRKKEYQDKISEISSKAPWSEDMPYIEKKVSALKDFYSQNAYDLMRGDFKKQLELKQLQNELNTDIDFSLQDKKTFMLHDKLIKENPTGYTDRDKSGLTSFASSGKPGERGYIEFTGKYDPEGTIKSVMSEVDKIEYNPVGRGFSQAKIGDKDFVETRSKQSKEAAKAILDSRIEADRNKYTDGQVEEYWTQEVYDNQLKAIENALGEKVSVKQLREDSEKKYGSGVDTDTINNRNKTIWRLRNIATTTDEAVNSLSEQTVEYSGRSLKTGKPRIDRTGATSLLIVDLYDPVKGTKVGKPLTIGADASRKEWNAFLNRFKDFKNIKQEDLDQVPDYTPAEGELLETRSSPTVDPTTESFVNLLSKAGQKEFVQSALDNKLTDDLLKLFPSDEVLSDALNFDLSSGAAGNLEKFRDNLSKTLKSKNSDIESVEFNKDSFTIKKGGEEIEVKYSDIEAIKGLVGGNSVSSGGKASANTINLFKQNP